MSDDRRSGLSPYHQANQPLTTLDVPHTGGAIEYFSNYWRRLNVDSKSRVFHSLVGLIQSQEAAVDAKISFEHALTRLENLDELRAAEEFRIQTGIDIDKTKLTNQLTRLLIEQMRLDLEFEEAKQALEKKRNPLPPEPKERRDPNIDALKETLYGGGIYTQAAEEMIDDLIRKRGGEDKLRPEDHNHIRNMRLEAKRLDQERGRR